MTWRRRCRLGRVHRRPRRRPFSAAPSGRVWSWLVARHSRLSRMPAGRATWWPRVRITIAADAIAVVAAAIVAVAAFAAFAAVTEATPAAAAAAADEVDTAPAEAADTAPEATAAAILAVATAAAADPTTTAAVTADTVMVAVATAALVETTARRARVTSTAHPQKRQGPVSDRPLPIASPYRDTPSAQTTPHAAPGARPPHLSVKTTAERDMYSGRPRNPVTRDDSALAQRQSAPPVTPRPARPRS